MAIRVQWETDGPFAVCDTAAEAIELLKQARASHSNGNGAARSTTNGKSAAESEQPQVGDIARSGGTSQKMDALVHSVSDKARGVLKKLAEHPDGIDGEEFSKMCGIDSSGLGGVFASVSKAAKRSHLAFDQFVVSEPRFDGARRFRWFAPTKLLLNHRDKL